VFELFGTHVVFAASRLVWVDAVNWTTQQVSLRPLPGDGRTARRGPRR
jgi:hypothetical protein